MDDGKEPAQNSRRKDLVVYVERRKPRKGPKRAKNLMLLDALLSAAEAQAVKEKTSCAEIVMDCLEERFVAPSKRKGRRGQGQAGPDAEGHDGGSGNGTTSEAA